MKKAITLFAAIVLAASLVSCGNSSTDNSSKTPSSSSSDNNEKIEDEVVVDPFENVVYTISGNLEEEVYSYKYPDKLEIQFDSSQSPFAEKLRFDYEVESTDLEKIIIKTTAKSDEISDFLKDTKYELLKIENIFEIKLSDINTSLISATQLKNENLTKLTELMQSYIDSAFLPDEIEKNLNEMILQSNNPDIIAEAQKNKENFEERENFEFTLEKLYAVLPKSETQLAQEVTIEPAYSNPCYCTVYIENSDYSNPFKMYSNVFGIFKNNKGKFCVVQTEHVVFSKGVLCEEEASHYVYYDYPDEASAYEEIIEKTNNTEDIVIEEIPLS